MVSSHHRKVESGRLANLHQNSIISRSDYTGHEGSILNSSRLSERELLDDLLAWRKSADKKR
jgi:hypothetical protein